MYLDGLRVTVTPESYNAETFKTDKLEEYVGVIIETDGASVHVMIDSGRDDGLVHTAALRWCRFHDPNEVKERAKEEAK